MSRNSQHGFTLLEVMLVLAVLVIVAAFTLPALSGPLENHRLRRAADQVRASWVRTRALAMEKGRTYVFTYAPGTDRFAVEAWQTGDDYLQSDQLISQGINVDGESLALEAAEPARAEQLPEGVTFDASETTVDLRAAVLATATPSQSDAPLATPSIYFYPDGTTSTVRLQLANQRNRVVAVAMRGLTGVVTVGGLQVRGETGW